MVEIKPPKNIREEIEKEKSIDVGKIKKRDTKAKSFFTYLESWKNIFKRENNTQGIILIEELQKKFLEFYPTKESYIEILEGWEKSTNEFPIWKDFENNFRVRIWHKDNWEEYKVEKDDLNAMKKAISQLEIGRIYKCYDIAKLLGLDWKEDIWKNRTEVYFKKYYVCLKILAFLGFCEYGGNKKSIRRLR